MPSWAKNQTAVDEELFHDIILSNQRLMSTVIPIWIQFRRAK